MSPSRASLSANGAYPYQPIAFEAIPPWSAIDDRYYWREGEEEWTDQPEAVVNPELHAMFDALLVGGIDLEAAWWSSGTRDCNDYLMAEPPLILIRLRTADPKVLEHGFMRGSGFTDHCWGVKYRYYAFGLGR
jgi:hypothetical protein